MGKLKFRSVAAAVALASATGPWVPFHSAAYPYSVRQPPSFRHIVLANTANQKVDFFFPSLGSFTTNVNILAQPVNTVRDEAAFLKAMNGQRVHRSGWLMVMGHKLAVMQADFNSLAGKYSIEQVRYVSASTSWQLTASYDSRFRRLRPTMLKMLASFQTDS